MSKFYSTILFSLFMIGTMPSVSNAQDTSIFNGSKLTVGLPLYVAHTDDRTGNRDWNDGWLNNEGIFADLSWPIYSFSPSTTLRAGVTGGVFDNSIFRTSVFLGGMAEIETFATQKLSFNLGTYAGGITGYEYSLSPAVAPYVGATYSVTDKIDLGLRGLWLPARTFAGGDIAEADAYVSTLTIGTRF